MNEHSKTIESLIFFSLITFNEGEILFLL